MSLKLRTSVDEVGGRVGAHAATVVALTHRNEAQRIFELREDLVDLACDGTGLIVLVGDVVENPAWGRVAVLEWRAVQDRRWSCPEEAGMDFLEAITLSFELTDERCGRLGDVERGHCLLPSAAAA